MTSRFEKFSERARKVLSLAQEEAQQFNHSYNVDNRYRGLEAPTSPPNRKAQDNIGSSRFLDSYVIRLIIRSLISLNRKTIYEH